MEGSVYKSPRVLPCGDRAVTVEFGKSIDPDLNRKVQLLSRQIKSKPFPGLIDLIPSYRSLLIQYDPGLCSYEELLSLIEGRLASSGEIQDREFCLVEIPVCYGLEFGPDLEEVAAGHGISSEEVIRLHATPIYQVYLIGFTPGFPFLGGLDPRLFTPRKKTPRKCVPAGSVGLAGQQTGIYSLDSPGGWQLIGRTPIKLFDLNREDPFFLKPGDQVRFRPIGPDEFGNH